MADMPGNAQELETISPQEAQLRQSSGGFMANGQQAPPAALIDSQLQGTAQQPDPYTMSTLKGTKYGSTNTGTSSTTSSQAGDVTPYDIEIPPSPSAAALKKIANYAGMDTSKISQQFFDNLSQHYKDVEHPSTLGNIQQWAQASGLGHFMQGAEAGSPSDQPVMSDNMPGAQERKAAKFFDEHIQARIIDGGRYIDGNGNYQPPDSYKLGSTLGSAITNPAGNLAGQFATERAIATLKPAVNGTLAYMAAHPQVGPVLGKVLKYTAIGYAAKKILGGSPVANAIPGASEMLAP
jgi:hypothetical protein